MSLKVGKTKGFKANLVKSVKNAKVKKCMNVRYVTSDNKVADLQGNKIKAVGKGTCYIYAYTQSGIYGKIKVTVK